MRLRGRDQSEREGDNIDDLIDGRVAVTITKLSGGGMFTEILQVDSRELSNPSEICFFSSRLSEGISRRIVSI